MKFNHYASVLLSLMCLIALGTGCDRQVPEATQRTTKAVTNKVSLKIILGTTRKGRTSDKIGNALKAMIEGRDDVDVEVLDLRDYNLPFLDDEVPPASRATITDPAVARWSDKINQGQLFIFVVPEYNGGYPGVLKNALDSIYKEWNNKMVAFVGYSGGPTGGSSAIAQLRQVAAALQLIAIEDTINIPSSWKAFDKKGNLLNKDIDTELNAMVDELISLKARTKK